MNAFFCIRFSRIGIFRLAIALGAGSGPALADKVWVDHELSVAREGESLAVRWQMPPACGTNLILQFAAGLNGSWNTLSNAPAPFLLAADQAKNGFFRAEWLLPPGSPSKDEIARSVRAYAFAKIPATEFDIRIEPVQGLWETMQLHLANVVCLSADGQQFNEFSCVIRQNSVANVGLAFGGHGLMSGVVRGDSLYFTHSWGSGVHRSHVARLKIVNGELKFWDSEGLFDDLIFRDVFVSRKDDGEIAIFVGRFQGFNRWQNAVEYGRIDESDPAAPKLIRLDGGVAATLTPTEY